MKNSQRGFVIPLLVVIVAVLAISVGIYVYQKNKQSTQTAVSPSRPTTVQTINSSTTDQTIGWRTYVNNQYGFQFQYPPTWLLSASNGNVVTLRTQQDEGDYVLSVVVSNTLMAESSFPIFIVPSRKIDSRENININNVSWVKLTVDDQVVQYVYKDGKTYSVSYAIGGLDDATQDQEVGLIAQSFKFLGIENQ